MTLPIETDRLLVRCFVQGDWRALQDLSVRYQATDVARLEEPWPTSDDGVQRMTAFFSRGDEFLAVCLKDSGALIGLVAINRRAETAGRVHNLGYVFHPDHHGRGYATEACLATLARVFDELGADAILTGTRAGNTGSVRLLRRLGLRDTGAGRGEYSLTREEWLARRKQGID